MEMESIARQSKAAAIQLAAAGTDAKNRALANIARALEAQTDAVQAANQADQSARARFALAEGLAPGTPPISIEDAR